MNPQKLKELLKIEEEAEKEEQALLLSKYSHSLLQKEGYAILGLEVSESRTGLGGKVIVTFTKSITSVIDHSLHKMGVGDVVKIDHPNSNEYQAGVITALKPNSISISLDELPNFQTGLRVVKLYNDISYRRMFSGLDRIEKSNIYAFMHSNEKIRKNEKKLLFQNTHLNDSQKRAVEIALASTPIALIHGPPGTGKTQTLV